MSVWGVTGGAGTGKTTRLLARLDERLLSDALGAEQRVLALARYHGARFRLIEKLATTAARGRADCFTFDRFAWRLCSRWRTRLRERGIAIPAEREFDETCAAAGSLLSDGDVLHWVVARYPIVVVDEFQDCRDGRLEIVQRLEQAAFVALAADEFQDLSSTGANPAVAWLQSGPKVEPLTTVHRTSKQGLIDAATAIRTGGTVVEGPGLRLIARPAAAPAASYITQTLPGLRQGPVAFITPTRPEGAPFARSIVELVGTMRYGSPPKGPYQIEWEGSVEDAVADYHARCGLDGLGDNAIVPASQLLAAPRGSLDKPMREWVERQRRLRGLDAFPGWAVRSEVHAAAQRLRGVARHGRTRVAMTVHQGKNREFPVVFVLWPREVRKETARRLLYNAITRAKEQAYVIVQGDSARFAAPPFAEHISPPPAAARKRRRPTPR